MIEKHNKKVENIKKFYDEKIESSKIIKINSEDCFDEFLLILNQKDYFLLSDTFIEDEIVKEINNNENIKIFEYKFFSGIYFISIEAKNKTTLDFSLKKIDEKTAFKLMI